MQQHQYQSNQPELHYEVSEMNRFFRKVYGWMALGLLVTFLTAFTILMTPLLGTYIRFIRATGTWGVLGITITQLALVFMLRPDLEKMKSSASYIVKFLLYSMMTGITVTLYFLIYRLDSIIMAFLMAAGVFVMMSVVGFVTKKDLTSLGHQALAALIAIILVSIISSFFFNSTMVELVLSIITAIVFVILTAYDTQKIKAMYLYMANSEIETSLSIVGALELYLDFINLFLQILRIFGRSRD